MPGRSRAMSDGPGANGGGMPCPVIELQDVRKVYLMGTTRVHALAGVDVRFGEGEFWAIMGPSGSGKSTMLNLLGCLDRPDQGQYLLEGKDVSRLEDDALSE